VPRSELSVVGYGIDYRKGKDTDWIYLRVPNEVRDSFAKIRRKLTIESRQLRGCSDGVIVLLAHGVHVGSLSAGDAELGAVVEEFARHHDSTTALAITTVPHKRDGTAGVEGQYFELSPSALPMSFWEGLVDLDRERSVLWELDALA